MQPMFSSQVIHGDSPNGWGGMYTISGDEYFCKIPFKPPEIKPVSLRILKSHCFAEGIIIFAIGVPIVQTFPVLKFYTWIYSES